MTRTSFGSCLLYTSHILDVVGPDEYKEHVDDNAFTNYMAHWNIRKAIEYHDMLKAEKPELFARLDEKLGLAEAYPCLLYTSRCV